MVSVFPVRLCCIAEAEIRHHDRDLRLRCLGQRVSGITCHGCVFVTARSHAPVAESRWVGQCLRGSGKPSSVYPGARS